MWIWSITILSIIGVVLNIYKNKMSFVCWIISNAVWCMYDYHIGSYAQSVLFAVYFFLSVWGLIKWGRKK